MLEKADDLRYNVKMVCFDMLVPAGHLLRKMVWVYDERLREEINLDRVAHGKKPLMERDAPTAERTVSVSTSDPDCGLFHTCGL